MVRAQWLISPFHRGDFGRKPFVLSVLEGIATENELSRGELSKGDCTCQGYSCRPHVKSDTARQGMAVQQPVRIPEMQT
jgi:hypothetical protein